ncbi:hypothetical protein K1719_035851 [Acacia pycnantha]|nr:hypothetical protein K1719_037551 [Acacia pycnantha]KAI9082111.1 hypothetical protein K1719_035851 [Acacia pycnantha]
MKKQETKDITYKIAWTVRNFSALKTNTLPYSQVFTVGDCNWRICLNKGNEDLALYLHVAHASSSSPGWSVYAYFTLTVANRYSRKQSIKGDLEYEFLANKLYWGFESLMALSKLQDPSNGYIVDDICMIEVEFVKIRPHQSCLSKKLKQVPANDPNEVDFKDPGRIDKASTISEEQKWKDMKNEESPKERQHLWEELEMSRLDLSWLEPYVKSALNIKEYLKRANVKARIDDFGDTKEQHIGKSG